MPMGWRVWLWWVLASIVTTAIVSVVAFGVGVVSVDVSWVLGVALLGPAMAAGAKAAGRTSGLVGVCQYCGRRRERGRASR